jgi:hypothetical protein
MCYQYLLMSSDLSVQVIADPNHILDLLNKSPREVAVRSRPLEPVRSEAAASELQRQLRELIDEWISSGVNPGGELPAQRSIQRIEHSCYRSGNDKPNKFLALWYMLSKQVRARVVFGPSDTPTIKLSFGQSDTANPYAAWIEASERIVTLLMSDLRYRIAKCRYPKCQRYFVLSAAKSKRVHANGTFCSTEHNRATSATIRTKKRRVDCHEKQIEWAAHRLASELARLAKNAQPWHQNCTVVQQVGDYVNKRLAQFPARTREGIKRNWVTVNRVAIERLASAIAAKTS